jgi:hypothetical protein
MGTLIVIHILNYEKPGCCYEVAGVAPEKSLAFNLLEKRAAGYIGPAALGGGFNLNAPRIYGLWSKATIARKRPAGKLR